MLCIIGSVKSLFKSVCQCLYPFLFTLHISNIIVIIVLGCRSLGDQEVRRQCPIAIVANVLTLENNGKYHSSPAMFRDRELPWTATLTWQDQIIKYSKQVAGICRDIVIDRDGNHQYHCYHSQQLLHLLDTIGLSYLITIIHYKL